jgi:hypothetical protein
MARGSAVAEGAGATRRRTRRCEESEEGWSVRYRVHRLDIRMTKDQDKLERFLNGLRGRVVSVVPNVTMKLPWAHHVDFVLVIEEVES